MASDVNQWRKFYYDEVEPSLWGFLGPVIIFIFSSVLTGYLYQNHTYNEPILKLPKDILAIGFAINISLSVLCWYWIFRKLPKFAVDEIGIIIAITKLDDKVDTELEKLYKKLEFLIQKENFKSKIKVRLLPELFRPKDEKAAHSLRDRMRGELIIWGQVDQGKHQDETHTFFRPVHFSYRVSLPPREASVISDGFKHVLANKKWAISDKENLIQREYIANNVEEVSLYIIGAVLCFAGKDKESIDVIEKVLSKYDAKQDLTHDDMTAILNIRSLLLSIYRKEINDLELWPNAKNRETDIKRAKILISELNKYEFFQNATLLECTIDFAEGGNRSKELALKAYQMNTKDGGACFSLAFLYFYDNEITTGWRWFKTAMDREHTPYMRFTSLSMTRWYEETLREHPDWHHLHFPLGIMYFYLMRNYKPAKESLETFLTNYENVEPTSMYRSLVYKAKNTLKKIERRALVN